MTLIALALPGQGRLTDIWRDWIAPWFGTGRWLLPFVLLAAGIYVERARTRPGGWELRLVGATIAFVAALGLIELMRLKAERRPIIGTSWRAVSADLITRPGAFVVLLGIMLAGLLIMLDVGLGDLLAPLGRAGRGVHTALSTGVEGDERPKRSISGDRAGCRRRPGRPPVAAAPRPAGGEVSAAVEAPGGWFGGDSARNSRARRRSAAPSRRRPRCRRRV